MKHLDSHTIVKFMCEKIRKQRPELLVSKVRKVYQSVTMTQSGSLSLMGAVAFQRERVGVEWVYIQVFY